MDESPFYVLQATAFSGEPMNTQPTPFHELQGKAMAGKETDELLKLRLDYAWNWFEYHAGQRARMVNYFLIITGILGAAYGNIVIKGGNEHQGLESVLLISGLVMSVGFVCLDIRNRQLVDLGEDVLRQLERQSLFSSFHMGLAGGIDSGILSREKSEEANWRNGGCCEAKRWRWLCHRLVKHSLWFPLLESFVGSLCLLGLIRRLFC